jgi:hypothetical protein
MISLTVSVKKINCSLQDGMWYNGDQLTWHNVSLTILLLEGRASLTRREDLELEFALDMNGFRTIVCSMSL